MPPLPSAEADRAEHATHPFGLHQQLEIEAGDEARSIRPLDGRITKLLLPRPAVVGMGASTQDFSKLDALGYELTPALHGNGNGSLFSVSHALFAREAGARSYRRAGTRARALITCCPARL
jgi:hypothetical protein